MTAFEIAYLAAAPFLPPLHRQVRRRLLQIGCFSPPPAILDVGGRKSHYTIGLPGTVTVTDLPRETQVQHQLHLGMTPEGSAATVARRSNVREFRFDDMTHSALPDASFDYALAVEVLEHVDQDARFVSEVYRVLRPGGVFLMTTPNGDAVKNSNPDHRRHYTRRQLEALLASTFDRVCVEYAIRGGRFRAMGLRSWSLGRPIQTALSMFGNVVNSVQSASPGIAGDARRTRHLMGIAWKHRLETSRGNIAWKRKHSVERRDLA